MTPCVRVKPGVKFDVIAPAGFRILSALDRASVAFVHDITITCGSEAHPPTDPHSTGEAYDIRTNDLAPADVPELASYLTRALGGAFTVIIESPATNPKATGAHIHIQRKKGTTFP